MLNPKDKLDFQELLTRFNTSPEGETVVANLLRSLEACIVKPALAIIILGVWRDKIYAEDALLQAHGHNPLSGEAALKYTESESLSTTTSPPPAAVLWDSIRHSRHDPFQKSAIEDVSNIKNLSMVMHHLLNVHDLYDPHSSGTALALSPHTSIVKRRKQKERITRALSHTPFHTTAKIHHKRWFWVTTQKGLSSALSGIADDSIAAKAVDLLGLVHFSRGWSAKSVADRYIVELQLASHFAPEFSKPSFIFADHNPRFVAWTDSGSKADKKWGRAADLEKYHRNVQLEQGEAELVRATPDQFTRSDLTAFRVLGYLNVNRWGASSIPEGTEVFADRLRMMQSKTDVVDKIMTLLG